MVLLLVHHWEFTMLVDKLRSLFRTLKGWFVAQPDATRLVYAQRAACPCGARMAYKVGDDFWDCSAILKGTANPNVKHEAQLPFRFWEVK